MFDVENNEKRFGSDGREYHFGLVNGKNISEVIEENEKRDRFEGMQKYMPIGSVVTLNNSRDLLMIIGFNVNNNGIIYDYVACKYPYGVNYENALLNFNHDQIDKVYSIGYINNIERLFKSDLNNSNIKGR